MNDFTFTEKGLEHYLYWQVQDRKTLKKINSLIDDIKRNGVLHGIGKPEPLKHRQCHTQGELTKQTALCMTLTKCKI